MCLCRFPCSPRSRDFRCARYLGCGARSTIPILRFMIILHFIFISLTLFEFTLLCCPQASEMPRRCAARERGRMTTRATDNTGAPEVHRAERQKTTESKSAYKTTEFVVYVLAVLGVLIASMIVDQSFGADPAWRYVTYLTVGYMISRGLAKAGSREPYRD